MGRHAGESEETPGTLLALLKGCREAAYAMYDLAKGEDKREYSHAVMSIDKAIVHVEYAARPDTTRSETEQE